MIKKVVIAAAGKGTRMLELAKDKSKLIIEVSGKPFLYYLLSDLKEVGLTDVVLVVGHHKEKMLAFVDSVKDEFQITVIDQFAEVKEKYGTACPIEAVEQVIVDEQFIALYGDSLYAPQSLKAVNVTDDFIYVGGQEVAHPERYGALVTKGDLLERILEKPDPEIAQGHLVNVGLYKFTPEIFSAIKQIDVSPRGEYELTDAISILAKAGKVKVIKCDYWLDFGRPEDVETVSNFLNSKPR